MNKRYFDEALNSKFLEGFNYYSNQGYEHALECFEYLVKTEPPSAFYCYYLGEILKITNKEDDALKYFEKALELDKMESILYFNIGLIHYYRKSFNIAEEYFKESINYFDEESNIFGNVQFDVTGAYSYLGNTLCLLNNFEMAKIFYKQCIQNNDQFVYVYYNLAILYWAENRFEDALFTIEKAIQLGSKSALAIFSSIKNRETTFLGRMPVKFLILGF